MSLSEIPENDDTKAATKSYSELVLEKANLTYKRGVDCQDVGDYQQAIKFFTKALMLDPDNVELYRHRAECFLRITDFKSAILNWRKICQMEPDNAENFDMLAFLYFFQGQIFFDEGLFPEALESFSHAAEMKPDVVGYHTRTIACLASLSRHGECLALVNKRLENETDNADLYVMRARLHDMFGNATLCYYDVKDALALEPNKEEALKLQEKLLNDGENYKKQAILLILQNKLKEALSRISQAIDCNPSVAEFHILRGALYRRLNNFDAAVDDFLIALDKSNHDEESAIFADAMNQLVLSYNDFAIVCYKKRHFNEAIKLLNKAIKSKKQEKGLYINRGDCFFQTKEYHFALADYQQALEMDPDDWEVKSRIAILFNEFAIMDYFERRYLEAEKKFTLAIDHNPKIAQFYISRARVRYLINEKSGAQIDLLCAISIDPNSEEIFSLIPRLFPGKSISDIYRSPLFNDTKRDLQKLFQSQSPPVNKQLRPISRLSSAVLSQLSDEVFQLAESFPRTVSPAHNSERRQESVRTPDVIESNRTVGYKANNDVNVEATMISFKEIRAKQKINSSVKAMLKKNTNFSKKLVRVADAHPRHHRSWDTAKVNYN